MQGEPLVNKFVAVLNKKIEVGSLMNALSHMAAGLVASYPEIPAMRFDSYVDKDGGEHSSISDHPFIILRADNGSQIRTLRQELQSQAIHFVDFTSTMTVGTYVEQKERTRQTLEAELEYYGICAFGNAARLSELTRKFSLWR